MKKAILFLTIITMISCQNREEESFDYVGSGVEFSLINDKGEDLLDPSNANAIDTSTINIYYMKDGVKTRYYQSHLDFQRGFNVFKHENEYRIAIFTDYSSDKNTTIVEWSENDVDTIEIEYKKSGGSVLNDKIWLNGEFVWEIGDNTVDPFFVLTK